MRHAVCVMPYIAEAACHEMSHHSEDSVVFRTPGTCGPVGTVKHHDRPTEYCSMTVVGHPGPEVRSTAGSEVLDSASELSLACTHQ